MTQLSFRPRARQHHYAPRSATRVRAYGRPRPGMRCDAPAGGAHTPPPASRATERAMPAPRAPLPAHCGTQASRCTTPPAVTTAAAFTACADSTVPSTLTAPLAARPAVQAPRFVLRRYTPQDLDSLLLQPAQAHLQAQLGARGYAQSLSACEAYTCLVETAQGEQVIACLGAVALAPHRALAWALIGGDAGPWMNTLHRTVRRWLAACPYTRLEAQVDTRFAAGRRWLALLGFKCETPQGMRGFCADGRAAHLYARLK